MPRKERKRKANQRNIETAAHNNCVKINALLKFYITTHITRFRLDGIPGRTAMGDNTVTGLVSWLRFYTAYCYVNFDYVSGETGD